MVQPLSLHPAVLGWCPQSSRVPNSAFFGDFQHICAAALQTNIVVQQRLQAFCRESHNNRKRSGHLVHESYCRIGELRGVSRWPQVRVLTGSSACSRFYFYIFVLLVLASATVNFYFCSDMVDSVCTSFHPHSNHFTVTTGFSWQRIPLTRQRPEGSDSSPQLRS